MRSIARTIALAVLLAALSAVAARGVPSGHRDFSPPDIKHASDIAMPFNSLALGMVSFLVTLDANGTVQNLQVMRDFPALTSVAQTSVQNWAFSPATKKGSPVPSNIAVHVVFNPYNPGGASFQTLSVPPALVPVSSASGGPNFIPPQVVSAAFAQFPLNSVAYGAVVLDVGIDASGQVASVRPIRKIASLTGPAVSAVKTWGFSPATLDGQPVAANVVVAFVYGLNAADGSRNP